MEAYSEKSIRKLVRCAKAVIENWSANALTSVQELDEAVNELEAERTKYLTRYRIVNTFDRPCENLIAELKEDGKLYYINPDFERRTTFGGMRACDSTPVEDFGLTLTLNDDGLLCGKVVRESVATYRDGRQRKWQGSKSFSLSRESLSEGSAR